MISFDTDKGVHQDEQLLFEFSTGPLPNKRKEVCRLFYNNINGMEINMAIAQSVRQCKQLQTENITKPTEQYTKVDAFFKQMKTWDVSIFALAEHCVEWEDAVPRLVLKDIGKKYQQKGMWNVATSKVNVGNYLKPGGTLLHSNEEMAIRTVQKGTDPWGQGRWTYQRYQAKKGTSLMLISAYRVGKRSGVPGSSTAWHQQKVLLTQQGRTDDPDDAFLTDIREWIRSQQSQYEHLEIIMFLDANERWSQQSKIRGLALDLGLVNLNLAGNFNFPSSHPSFTNPDRNTTIDFCLCSESVLQSVEYATMAPYDLTSLGDHRGMLVDLNMNKLLGDRGSEKIDISSRNLITSNTDTTAKYLETVDKGFCHQNVYARIEKLFFQWSRKQKSRWEVMKAYEKLDVEVHTICLKAERQCKAVNNGKWDWSPALHTGIQELSYWRARLKYRHENLVISQLGKQTGIEFIELTEQLIREKVFQSRLRLEEIQKNSVHLRRNHLEARAEIYASENNLSKAQAVQELVSHESVRNTFKLLKSKLRADHAGPLTKIWVSRDDQGTFIKDINQRTVYDTKDEVHKHLLQRNRKHLRQAKKTPFASGRWSQELKWDGTGDLGNAMLSGDLLHQRNFSSTVKAYFESLAQCRMQTGTRIVNPILSLSDYKKFWKCKRETTVTSPFGLHVGHYKAALQNDKLLNVHRLLLLIPFQTGLVPSRWRKTVQTMLEKDPGQPWIHRLRIIELFDAQVNAGFQIFIGRQMIWAAVQNSKLHPASYGSTPGKMAASAVLQKVLSVDQLKIERRAGGIFDCDATGCYDRIIPPLASIHLQALGLGSQIATVLARLMFMATRHVKTKHGVSKKGIRTKHNAPLYGIGQGNGGGPAIWLAHLTVMFYALGTLCQGMVIYGIDMVHKLCMIGTGYVDDVTIIISVSKQEPQTELSIKTRMKRIAQKWEQLLFITGGKLELSKCFWVPILWKWKKGEPQLKKPSARSGDLILVESETKDRIHILRLSTADAPKRLGIRYSVDGSWKAEYKFWQDFTDEYVRMVRRARLDRLGGFHAYATLWCAKFRYCSPCLGFNKTKLAVITKKVMGPCLAAAGYSSKMPRAVVFGPSRYGGLEWETPHSMLLNAQLSLLVGSVRMDDTVGKLIQIQLEWLQVHAGTETPVLELNKQLGYLPVCWLSNLHGLLVDAGVKVSIPGLWRAKIRRKNDVILMDYVQKHLPDWMWKGINMCRLFLQAIVLSDLTTIDGTEIPSSVYNVETRVRNSRIAFPLQGPPPDDAIESWQYLLRHILGGERKLPTPLGDWANSPYQFYPFVMGVTNRLAYKLLGPNRWEVYYQQENTRNIYVPAEIVRKTLPEMWVPIRVILLSLRRIAIIDINTIPPPRPLLVPKLGVFNLRDERQVVGQFEIDKVEFNCLRDRWRTESVTLLCGTDGGLKDDIGSSGYIITDPLGEIPLVKGHAAERAMAPDSSSTRQELLAQLAVVYWIQHILLVLGIPGHSLTIQVVTDSQASIDILEKCTSLVGIKDVLSPEMNVALEIDARRRQLQDVIFTTIKVRSHIPEDEAPDICHWGVNEAADQLATEARHKATEGDLRLTVPILFAGAKAGCIYQGKLIIGNLKKELQHILYTDALVYALGTKYGWTDGVISVIDWDAHTTLLTTTPILQRVTLAKFIHGWLATKKRRCRNGSFVCPNCTFCDAEEDSMHMFKCPSPQFRDKRKSEVNELMNRLRKHTREDALTLLRIGLTSVTGQYDMADYCREFLLGDELLSVAKTQGEIGWEHLLMGRAARSWRLIGPVESFAGDTLRWAKFFLQEVVKYGLHMWTYRNMLVHGTSDGVSVAEDTKARLLVELLYTRIAPWAPEETKWLFLTPLPEKQQEPYSLVISWIDSIRRVFPVEYREVHRELRQTDIIEKEVKHVLAHKAGHTGL